jgi:hypothetical protein
MLLEASNDICLPNRRRIDYRGIYPFKLLLHRMLTHRHVRGTFRIDSDMSPIYHDGNLTTTSYDLPASTIV